MIKHDFSKRPLVEHAERLSVSTYMRRNMAKVREIIKEKTGKEDVGLVEEKVIKDVLEAIEESFGVYITQTRGEETGSTEATKLKLTYTKSNLGRGFIVWFRCNNCNQRVRYLYASGYNPYFYCRKCHGLVYKKQNEARDRLVAEMLRNPEIIYTYLGSGSWKYQLAAIKAQMIRERAREEIRQEVKEENGNE